MKHSILAAVSLVSLDEPTSVAITRSGLWVTEGQVLRQQSGEPPHLPFKVRRVALTW